MYWTFELADYLHDAPWPATKKELIDYCERNCLPAGVLQNLEELPDDEDIMYHSIEDLYPDHPKRTEYYYGSDEEEGFH